MLKTANAIKKFQAAGASIEQVADYRIVAHFAAADVLISNRAGCIESLYVIKHGHKDDITTDSFPGTFKDTIKGAIELAQRMATW